MVFFVFVQQTRSQIRMLQWQRDVRSAPLQRTTPCTLNNDYALQVLGCEKLQPVDAHMLIANPNIQCDSAARIEELGS